MMKADATAGSRKQSRHKEPKNAPSEPVHRRNQEHREKELEIPFVEDLVSDEDKKDAESRGTFKDGGTEGRVVQVYVNDRVAGILKNDLAQTRHTHGEKK